MERTVGNAEEARCRFAEDCGGKGGSRAVREAGLGASARNSGDPRRLNRVAVRVVSEEATGEAKVLARPLCSLLHTSAG